MISIIIILDVFAMALQIYVTWFAYKLYRFNRLSFGWIAFIVAFIVQVIRRGFQIYYDSFNLVMNSLLDRSLMLLISLLLFVGLWSMLKSFENFEIVEKKVKFKLNRGKRK